MYDSLLSNTYNIYIGRAQQHTPTPTMLAPIHWYTHMMKLRVKREEAWGRGRKKQSSTFRHTRYTMNADPLQSLKPCSIFREHIFITRSGSIYEFQIHSESQFSTEFVSSNFYSVVVAALPLAQSASKMDECNCAMSWNWTKKKYVLFICCDW